MTAVAFKEVCHSFAQAAAPYLPIKEDAHYAQVLELVENLLEEAEDSPDAPINAIIDLLSHAIETYENQDEELAAFEKRVMGQSADMTIIHL